MNHQPAPPDDVVRIFVSYSRKDKRWLDRAGDHDLIPYLVDSMKNQNVVFWYDKDLVASEKFLPRILEEIDKADIAILLVSQPFLNSGFIEKHELPRIKERADKKELSVVPVLVKPCSWEEDDFLSARQMLPGKPTPLINYTGNEAEWEQVRFDLLEGIKKLVKKIRAERAQAGELQKRDQKQAEAHRMAAERKQHEDARRAAEAEVAPVKEESARAKADPEKAKAEQEAKGARVAAERKQREDARLAAEEEMACAKAEAEKTKAESQPTLKLLALLDGQVVHGSKVICGNGSWETPIVLPLNQGDAYNFKLAHTDDAGRQYAGVLRIVAAWSGERTERVKLSRIAVFPFSVRSAPSVLFVVPPSTSPDAPTGSSWDGVKVEQRRKVDLGGGVRLELCGIPAGKFTMGGSGSDEPPHEVTLTKPFWLGRTQVTQAQWEAVMGNNPSRFKGKDLPVEQVSWDDAFEFSKKLNAKGLLPAWWRWALPSEAQWEYACRAGTPWDYAGSLDEMAWHASNSGGVTHPVATKKPNAWGLHNMHSNVSEWCADWYWDYPKDAVSDPTGPDTGSYRVFRGGSWGGSGTYCRSADRFRRPPNSRDNLVGFRVAAVPSGS